jgi:serine/threonine protein phosphatase PrpC
MTEKFFGLTDTGRQRQNNEDTFFTEEVLRGKFMAACVIDGVGGYEGGEVAAAIARETILNYFSVPSGSVLTMLQEALISANEKIYQQRQQNAEHNKMACVVTLVLVEKGANKFYYAHVGDTRLYLFRDQSLVKVTKDHSFVGFLEDSGRLDEDAAMTHPKRNEINRALGFEAPLSNSGDYIETGESPFLPGDLLLLCSDGLTDMIDKKKISSILAEKVSLEEKSKALINAANNAGGKDNITVVLVQNDHTPVKQEATKPIKKNELVRNEAVLKESKHSSHEVLHKSSKGIIIFLVVLTLLSVAGFIWQWLQKTKLEDEVKPIAALNAKPQRNNIEQRLVDTLQKMSSDTLFLSNAAFGDVIFLSDTLAINRDSVFIKGEGNTILAADTAHTTIPILIAPSAKYVMLDSLILQDINIFISYTNANALHFKKVQMQNAHVFVMDELRDTIFTGTIKELQHVKDSLAKKGAK